ncbi:MAG: hypothetical protein ACRDU4_03745 [Mycobacterium sp.]
MLLKAVADWVDAARTQQKARDANAVVGLPAGQKARVVTAIAKLEQATPALTEDKARAAGRIALLLRAFMSVNDAGYAGAPKLDELLAVKTKLAGGLEGEFDDLFGYNIPFFADYADLVANQISARGEMKDAGAAPGSPVASQDDANTFFTKLKDKPNGDVIGAYQDFATAYFYHRGLASVEDLKIPLPSLLGTTASITGTRPLVCTGYARMGAELMGFAGGKAPEFVIGIRATPEELRTSMHFDDAHAIVRIVRNGSTFYISNGRVKDNEAAAFDPGVVDWAHPENELHPTRGATMDEAIAKFLKSLKRGD